MNRKLIPWFAVALLALAPAGAQEPAADAKAIVEKIDQLYRSNTSYARLQMTIVTPDWQRTLELEAWSRGMDQTFILIGSPVKDRGTATLRIKNEMWNFFPKIDKVMRVPTSMMMGSWMGSDFSNDDLVKESTLLDDYTYRLLTPAAARPDCYYLELKPKAATVTVWAKIEIVVQKADYLPVKETYFEESGAAMRAIEFKEVKELGGRKIPTVMELTPTAKPGNRTLIRYLQAEFDRPLPADTFSLQNLQKKR